MLHTNNSWSSTCMIFKLETGHKLNVIRRPFYAPRKHEGNQNLLFLFAMRQDSLKKLSSCWIGVIRKIS